MPGFGDDRPTGHGPVAGLAASGLIGLFSRHMPSGQAHWDPSLFEMTGLDPAHGAPDWDTFLAHVHAEDRAGLHRHFMALGGQVPQRGDVHFRFCRPDGRTCWLHTLYDVQVDAAGTGLRVTGVMVDDSRAGRLLEAGDRSRDFLREVLTSSGVAVWSIDLETRLVRFDAAGVDILGLGAGREQSMPVDEFRQRIHPEDRAGIEEAAERATRADGVVDAVARYRMSGGQWRALLTRRIAVRGIDGHVIGLMGVALDLEGRDGEKARAVGLADRSRLVAHAMGVGFWQSEADGSGLHWDEQMYRLHGRDPLQPPPSLDDWLEHDVLPEAREEARNRLHVDSKRWALETVLTVPVRGRGGSDVRWIRSWTRRLEHGGHRRLMGMHQDVTEQRRLKAIQADAERAERASREKSAFMSNMSHHLRTPLNAVLGFTQLLMQDSVEPLSARQRDWLSRIDAAGQELLGMLDEVFELATLEPSTAEPGTVTFDAVVNRLCDAVRPLAQQRSVGLWLGAPPVGLRLSTDPGLLGQALQHLLAHAVRRSERGGGVELAFGSVDDFAWLDVRDGGPRLDPLQRELWFEPAAEPSLSAAAEDEPMGLDLVRQALDRLGVRLEWRDDARGRTVLRVCIPRVADVPVPGPEAPPPLSLLCIEDNPVNMLLVRELVARRPAIAFRGAADGAAGLAQAFEAPPDVVLLDLNLPDMNGREVLDRLRADPRTAHGTVIALSAGALPEDIRSAREHGFDDYWTKPIDFDRFLAGLDALAARRSA